uniref:Uncharacterized protein n=1 Tax=Panagrellus redivivus TaxID=6233 RepID=A0A7E4UVE9_PANRE
MMEDWFVQEMAFRWRELRGGRRFANLLRLMTASRDVKVWRYAEKTTKRNQKDKMAKSKLIVLYQRKHLHLEAILPCFVATLSEVRQTASVGQSRGNGLAHGFFGGSFDGAVDNAFQAKSENVDLDESEEVSKCVDETEGETNAPPPSDGAVKSPPSGGPTDTHRRIRSSYLQLQMRTADPHRHMGPSYLQLQMGSAILIVG